MSNEKKLFAVESIVTFFEINLVEAENEEQAKKIAGYADYNISKHVSTNPVQAYEVKNREIKRFEKFDQYMWKGYSCIDEDGMLVYKKLDGTINGNMPPTKIDL